MVAILAISNAGFAASKKSSAAKKDAKAGVDFFEKHIRPVLVESCYECHSTGAKNIKGGLYLDTREGLLKGGDSGAAVVPGDASTSLLMEAIKHQGLEMPPKGKLPEETIVAFARWIEMGAPDPRKGKSVVGDKKIAPAEFWAYQRPQQHQAPQVHDGGWVRSDIDRFVLAKLEAENLRPVADADRVTLLRRVTFDLIGLPPTPAEIRDFLADDSPKALERVVDRLLESPHFGERWGRHWLDVARYGESSGKERNLPYAFAWRYRDWVIDAVNADMPYDQFVQQQIAGDLLPAEDGTQRNAQLVATGFLALGPKSVNEKSSELYLMDVVDEQIDVTCRAVLATTAACARCHDHKFDPIPTTDYYALAGIFRSTRVYSGVQRGAKDNDRLETYMTLGGATADLKEIQRVRKIEESLAAAKEEYSSLKKDKKSDYSARKERAKQLNEQIKSLEEKLPSSKRKKESVDPSVLAMGVGDLAEPIDCEVCIRGEVENRGPEVPRGFLTVLTTPESPTPNPKHSGRLELSEWLTSRDNPLTARVAVNRVWAHLFGDGIVESVDNFGYLGDKPSHPELLDTLAVDFMNEGWSIKRLVRSIVLSRTYQLSSEHDAKSYEVDPDNRLLWQMSRRRLDAEAIRDAVLASSGQLDTSRPEGSPIAKIGLGEIGRNFKVKQSTFDSNCRSVYLTLMRNMVPEALSVFDAADPSLVVGEREVTTVATQALFMMNSPFIVEQSQHAAERIEAEAPKAERIDAAYLTILGREPTKTERQRAAAFLENEELAALCQVLYASAEFRYLY